MKAAVQLEAFKSSLTVRSKALRGLLLALALASSRRLRPTLSSLSCLSVYGAASVPTTRTTAHLQHRAAVMRRGRPRD